MSDNLAFLDEGREETTETTTTGEAGAETTQETGAESTQAAAETTTEQTAKANEDLAAKIKGLEAAAAAERHKRQMVEAELAKKQQEEKPYLGEEYEARFTETEQRFQQQLVSQKLDLSEAFAREKYNDFDAKLEVFASMVTENPALYAQMVQQVNPAEFAYKTASNQQKLKEMGDPTEYEKRIREEERARVKAEYDAKIEEEVKKRTSLPGSIANASGAGGATPPAWSGPAPLDDILK